MMANGERYAYCRETPGDMPSGKIVRYARLSCGCTLDLTASEWRSACTMPDGAVIDCPKCSDKNVYIMATWKPGEVEGDWA